MIARSPLLAILVALAAGSANAAPQITEPDWLERPTIEAMSHAYPPLASAIDIEGVATIACEVDELGVLRACKVDSERPPEFGFGRAALSLAPSFRMRPKLADGKPVAGGEVRIPISFRLPKVEPETPVPPPAESRMRLGRRIAEIIKAEAFLPISRFPDQVEKAWREPLPDATRKAVADELRKALAEGVPEFRERVARAYASELNEAQLQALATFLETPAGKLFVPIPELIAAQQQHHPHLRWLYRETLRQQFCQRHACASPAEVEQFLASIPAPSFGAPIWTEAARRVDIRRATPAFVTTPTLNGAVQLDCQVGQQGLLRDCKVARELPEGLGLGQAALAVAPLYRLRESQLDVAVGKPISVGLQFRGDTLADDPYEWPAPSPEAGRRVAETFLKLTPAEEQALFAARMKAWMPKPGNESPAARQAMEAAVRAATELDHRTQQAFLAKVLGSMFTEDQLKAAVAFFRTPAGQAFRARRQALEEALTTTANRYSSERAALVGERYCRIRSCALVQHRPQPTDVSPPSTR